MKIIRSPRAASAGYALIMVLLFIAISVAVLSASLKRTGNITNLNDRNNQFVVSMFAAEAATEKVLALMMADYRIDAETRVIPNLDNYRNAVPTSTESAYWSNFRFTDGQGNIGKNYVSRLTTDSNPPYVALHSQYEGLSGFASTYRVISNVRQLNGRFNLTNAVQQEIQLAEIPVFQFAIFYNGLLEFTWAAPLTIRGRVHSNGDIITGSAWALTFQSLVSATGTIQKKGWAGYALSSMTATISYNGSSATNVPTLSLPVGTNNTASAVREIINTAPSGEDANSEIAKQRYYNKAELLILVSNATVKVQVKQPFDTAPVTIPWSNSQYFIATNRSFYDDREDDYMKTTEIDVAKFKTWAATNTQSGGKLGGSSGNYNAPNIIYVADFRSTVSSTNTAVRLINGTILPNRGLTVATPNPLYIKGNYNVTNSAHLNTTNTSSSLPASVVSDALTVLSGNWDDTKSANSLDSRNDATSTTVNAAIITGDVDTIDDGSSTFSGGAMNLPRLLEDWGSGGSIKLTLNTSMVNLFNSVKAVAPWRTPGTYYQAPTRDFNFDQNFLNVSKLPPGTPKIRALVRAKWSNPPPNTLNYAGF